MDDVCISHNSVIELSGDVISAIRDNLTINADNLTYDLDEELLLLGGVNFLARQLMKAHLINGRETLPEEF